MTDHHQLAQERLTQARRDIARTGDLPTFFDALFAGADAEDILMSEALVKIASTAKNVLDRHQPGDITVELLPGPDAKEPQDLLVAINDDRPFLYDSALRAAAAGGGHVRAAFHPIVSHNGKSTSVIVLLLDMVGARDELTETMRKAFGAGMLAVRDWKKMLERLKAVRDELAAHPPQGRNISEDLAFLDWLADNNFTFLGARDYKLNQDGGRAQLEPVDVSGLGVLADAQERVLRKASEPRELSREVQEFLN